MIKPGKFNSIRQFIGEVVVALILLSLLIFGCGENETPTKDEMSELMILSTTPADNASDVSSDTSITIKFSKAINGKTLNERTMFASDEEGKVIRGKIEYDESSYTVRFIPNKPFSPGTRYTVTVSRRITAVDGGKLTEDFSWTFTTKPPEPPTIIQTKPADGETQVPVHVTIEVVFSKPINPATLTEETLLVLDMGANRVQSSLKYDRSNNTAYFEPQEYLNPETQYTVTLSNQIAALDGSALENKLSWSFRTASPDYLPLAIGNWWLYDVENREGKEWAGTSSFRLEVTGVEEWQGRNLYTLIGRGFNSAGNQTKKMTIQLFKDESNQVFKLIGGRAKCIVGNEPDVFLLDNAEFPIQQRIEKWYNKKIPVIHKLMDSSAHVNIISVVTNRSGVHEEWYMFGTGLVMYEVNVVTIVTFNVPGLGTRRIPSANQASFVLKEYNLVGE